MPGPVRSLHRPITLNGRFVVTCSACSLTADSAAGTAEGAVTEWMERHKHHGAYTLMAAPVDFKEHPLFQGRFEHEDVRRVREGATGR